MPRSITIFGTWYEESGEIEFALASYEKAIDLNKCNPDAYTNTTSLRILKEDYAEALRVIDSCIENYPPSARAHAYRGDVLLELQDYEAALKDFDRAIAIDPLFAYAFRRKGQLLSLRTGFRYYSSTLEYLNKAVELDSTVVWVFCGKRLSTSRVERFGGCTC